MNKLIIQSEEDYRNICNHLYDDNAQILGYQIQQIKETTCGEKYNVYYNMEIDLSNAPLLEEKDTGKQFRQVFSAPKSGVSYYIREGEKLFLDSSGVTRPSRTEKHHMGMGIYMSDAMFKKCEYEQLTLF
tara:strand:- start:6934 stop:7323 length:390 start_codon:yes stop_codon:yes gene_type:complete